MIRTVMIKKVVPGGGGLFRLAVPTPLPPSTIVRGLDYASSRNFTARPRLFRRGQNPKAKQSKAKEEKRAQALKSLYLVMANRRKSLGPSRLAHRPAGPCTSVKKTPGMGNPVMANLRNSGPPE